MVDSSFIQQQTFIISFCLTKLTDGHGKFNGRQNLLKEWLFVSFRYFNGKGFIGNVFDFFLSTSALVGLPIIAGRSLFISYTSSRLSSPISTFIKIPHTSSGSDIAYEYQPPSERVEIRFVCLVYISCYRLCSCHPNY